ncbi:hypothetical protein G3R49_06745 [Shewanella sp. WXL01]|uniref:Uncharacterized protein n=1 Tax=Shewanella maritima TaxID=2520507 RepID=A0A411PE65_9GAMM|nr:MULTISPECIES: hypothetical protein [Shewanella]NKF50270.1 hypothetical protein [Shewanella sp. WXL01]QBF81700.1 hypothetical protein EXU30_02580 [Shewanella maritima]
MKTVKSLLAVGVALGLFSAQGVQQAQACQYHSGPMFGAIGAQHGPGPGNFRPVPRFKLKHEDVVTVSAGEHGEIPIQYRVPRFYKDMALEIKSGAQLVIESEPTVSLEGAEGELILSFLAEAKGAHNIEMLATGMRDGRPYSLIKVIRVNAI